MSITSVILEVKPALSRFLRLRNILAGVITAFLLVAFAPAPSAAGDIIYPDSAGLSISQTLSTTSLVGGDTLIISRSLINSGALTVSGLYFSQTIPREFSIAGSDVTLNGQPIVFAFEENTAETTLTDWRIYHWIIDDPTGLYPVNTTIAPGDSLELTIRTVYGQPGEFVFPDWATVLYAGGSGYFAVMDGPAPVVTILPCCVTRGNVDADDESGSPIDVADLTYLVAYIFRTGPPPPCEEQANVDGSTGTGVQVNIADVSALAAYLFLQGAPPPPCDQ